MNKVNFFLPAKTARQKSLFMLIFFYINAVLKLLTTTTQSQHYDYELHWLYWAVLSSKDLFVLLSL